MSKSQRLSDSAAPRSKQTIEQNAKSLSYFESAQTSRSSWTFRKHYVNVKSVTLVSIKAQSVL